MGYRWQKPRSTEKEASKKRRGRMWRQLNIFLVCFFGKRTAFIANQAPKDWCANRMVLLCVWHVVTLPVCCDCSGEVPNLVGSCSLLLLDTQGPCETWGTAPLHGFLHLKWDFQSWVHSVCHNVKVAWRRHWAFSNHWILPLFVRIHLRWHLTRVCICLVWWLIGFFFQKIYLYDWGRF